MYYLLQRRYRDGSAMIDQTSHFDYSLKRGTRVPTDFPVPMTFEIDTDMPGVEMPSLFLDAGPLFRPDLLETFVSLGVDNLETFAAEIRHPENGRVWKNYVAVNIVGLVSCADLGKSASVDFGPFVAIQQLVIDPTVPEAGLMVRLAEDPVLILVSDRIVSRFPADRFPDVIFEDVSEGGAPIER